MLVNLKDIKMHNITEEIERWKRQSEHYRRVIEATINEAKTKTPSLQTYKKIKAIVNKLILKVKQYTHDTHIITENILTQNTYYKTLTSRP